MKFAKLSALPVFVVPSSGPTNVSAFATTSSSILVRWGEVLEADRNGLILGYKVSSQQSPSSLYHSSENDLYVRIAITAKTFNNPCVFQVVYKEKDSDTAPNFWAVEGNTSHSVQLSSLGKYVLYEIQVLAFTRIGDGRSSSPSILERTLDDGKKFCT